MKLQESIRDILIRELRTLKRELEAYGDEGEIWKLPAGISNSAGTLALHLVGNLQAFVGAALGGSGYKRNRPAEFSRDDVPRADITSEIERTVAAVETTLTALPDRSLSEPFPVAFGEFRVSTGDFLIHLAAHLAFHVGQVDYHRRLITRDNHSIGPLAIPELATASATD